MAHDPAERIPNQRTDAGSDAIYYQHAGNLAGARGMSAWVRSAMYDLFLRQLRPTESTKVLDIGVSDEEGPETNMLEQKYPWPENIVCAGLGDGAQLRTRYPATSYVRISAGEALPFRNKSFDIVYSNAVLEHVGGKEERIAFLREVVRIGHSAFITFPNRWFPIEHHTGIPFLHWNAGLFRLALRRTNLCYWSDPRNVEFLSKRTLQLEWPTSNQPIIHYSGIRLGPFSSNLAIVAGDL